MNTLVVFALNNWIWVGVWVCRSSLSTTWSSLFSSSSRLQPQSKCTSTRTHRTQQLHAAQLHVCYCHLHVGASASRGGKARRRERRYGPMAREYRTHGAGRASRVVPHTAHRTPHTALRTPHTCRRECRAAACAYTYTYIHIYVAAGHRVSRRGAQGQ